MLKHPFLAAAVLALFALAWTALSLPAQCLAQAGAAAPGRASSLLGDLADTAPTDPQFAFRGDAPAAASAANRSPSEAEQLLRDLDATSHDAQKMLEALNDA
ncbi:MAG: hypothetical protein LBW85_14130 [Deltaproteobacteria bacterium]|jgi:hypothetical protein|nr:hypothetical protein [Deltaproteobacteria bacterium]